MESVKTAQKKSTEIITEDNLKKILLENKDLIKKVVKEILMEDKDIIKDVLKEIFAEKPKETDEEWLKKLNKIIDEDFEEYDEVFKALA